MENLINKILEGDALSCLEKIKNQTLDCCVTSPPYFGLRDYKTKPINWPAVKFSILGTQVSIPQITCELGQESSPNEFIGHLVIIFREIKRTLKNDGTLWLNIADSYARVGGDQKGSFGTRKVGTRKRMTKVPKQDDNLKEKDLIGIPWMLAFALRADGWYLRQDIIWHKPNPMPESVTDRCTKSHEYIFLLSKQAKYYYDHEAIKTQIKDSTVQRMLQQIDQQKGSSRVPGKTNGTMKAVGPGRNPSPHDTRGGNQGSSTGIKAYKHRGNGDQNITGHSGNFDSNGNLIGDGMANKKSVWTVSTKPFKEAHYATYPQELIEPCIKAGCPENGIVIDPFAGSGTTGIVASKLGRNFILIEMSPESANIARRRFEKETGIFNPLI